MFRIHAHKIAHSSTRQKQPLDTIRAYFGDEIAMYFAFLGFYAKWLMYPGIIGVFFFLWQRLHGTDNTLLFLYCFGLSMWSLLFVQFWKRKESSLAFKWGASDIKTDKRDRREYKPSNRYGIVLCRQGCTALF